MVLKGTIKNIIGEVSEDYFNQSFSLDVLLIPLTTIFLPNIHLRCCFSENSTKFENIIEKGIQIKMKSIIFPLLDQTTVCHISRQVMLN